MKFLKGNNLLINLNKVKYVYYDEDTDTTIIHINKKLILNISGNNLKEFINIADSNDTITFVGWCKDI